MSDEVKYLDYEGLEQYNDEIVNRINRKADSDHKHAASDITSGTLPIIRGGTGATTAAGILTKIGITATADELNKMDGVTASTTEINKLKGLVATTDELNCIDGITSNIQSQLDNKLASTTKYAASSSVGGSAILAEKLNANAGSATQPVYFANGVPVKTTYTLGKSVPSNAVFTDTVEVYVQATEPTSPNAKIWIQTT